MDARKTARDEIDRNESAEIILHIPWDKGNCVLLAASPSGGRFDLSSKSWTGLNPDWQCATGRFAEGWTLEARIPFTELIGPGQVAATPQVEDVWRMQVYRKQSDPREVSQWLPTGSGAALKFSGRKDGPELPTFTAAFSSISHGPSACNLTCRNTPAGAVARCAVIRAGTPMEQTEKSLPNGEGKAELPYRLIDAGEHRVRTQVITGKQVLFVAEARVSLTPVTESVKSLEKEVTEAKKSVADDRHPEFARIRKEGNSETNPPGLAPGEG